MHCDFPSMGAILLRYIEVSVQKGPSIDIYKAARSLTRARFCSKQGMTFSFVDIRYQI